MYTDTQQGLSRKSSEALAIYRRVKMSSGEFVYSDAGETAVGVTSRASLINTTGHAKLINDSGSFAVTSAGAFAVDALLYGADDGKVDDTVSGDVIGIALEASTVANQIIEMARISDSDSVQQSAIADPAAPDAITSGVPAVPTDYTAPTPAQATPVTSAAATDLDDAAAALATLVDEFTTAQVNVAAIKADVAALRVAIVANKAAIDAILVALETNNTLATS